jgi:hypothetical protein
MCIPSIWWRIKRDKGFSCDIEPLGRVPQVLNDKELLGTQDFVLKKYLNKNCNSITNRMLIYVDEMNLVSMYAERFCQFFCTPS